MISLFSTIKPPSFIINNRDNYVDLMKAIGILLMVIGHNELSYWFGGLPRNIIYTFHIPLFFILSGYLYIPQDLVTTVKRSAKSLLYPYLTFGLITLLIRVFRIDDYSILLAAKVFVSVNSSQTHSVWLSEDHLIGPIWFLVSLFWGRTIFAALIIYCKYWTYPLCVALSFLAFQLGEIINLPFGLLTGISSLVFISVGYFIKKHGIPLVCILILLILWPVSIQYPMDMADFLYTAYPLNILGALGGTIGCFMVAMVLSKTPLIKAFGFFGHHSLHVLCWHTVIIALFPYEVVTGVSKDLLFVVAPFVITYVTAKCKLFSFLFKWA